VTVFLLLRRPGLQVVLGDRWRRDRSLSSIERRTVHMLDTLKRSGAEGQGLAEYALILSLIAVIAITALVFLGGEISSILSSIGTAV
jgi:pilus assembly protein Flp/PilA